MGNSTISVQQKSNEVYEEAFKKQLLMKIQNRINRGWSLATTYSQMHYFELGRTVVHSGA